MPGDYAVLAPVYDTIGMAEFAQRATPRLIDYAQRNGWLGRTILDAGCGTGGSIQWLARRSYKVIGVDSSAEMLEVGQRNLQEYRSSIQWHKQDLRKLGPEVGAVDMVLALNVLNEVTSLRELEEVLACLQRTLEPEKWLIFDLVTVQGLTEEGLQPNKIVYNDKNQLTVVSSDDYDYERQVHNRRFIIFQRNGTGWERSEAELVTRAFPVQAVAALVQRLGLKVEAVLDQDFQTYEPGKSRAEQVIFIAVKQP